MNKERLIIEYYSAKEENSTERELVMAINLDRPYPNGE